MSQPAHALAMGLLTLLTGLLVLISARLTATVMRRRAWNQATDDARHHDARACKRMDNAGEAERDRA